MLQAAWFIARKDIQYMVRGRETILWLFVMPIVFFYFVGTITGGFGGGSDKERLAVQVPDDAGFLADDLLRRLEAAGYETVQPTTAEAFADATRRLTLPPHFTESALAGKKVVLQFTRKEAGLGQQ